MMRQGANGSGSKKGVFGLRYGIRGVVLTVKSIFISGGARSGKSSFAQELASDMGERILFVATAEPLDTDMRVRIEKHRRERPRSWRTLEVPASVAASIRRQLEDAEVVVIDCLTLLVSNLMPDGESGFTPKDIDVDELDKRMMMEIEALLALIREVEVTFIIVSNEVGLGVVPDNRLARVYRDLLGRANQRMAREAEVVYFMVSGIPVQVKGKSG